MTVYLVGDPAKGGRMDFAGFMVAYTQFFGTKEQPNLPARSTVQVAGLVAPGHAGRDRSAACEVNYKTSLLLTNATCAPSGDHDGTLIVPWPP